MVAVQPALDLVSRTGPCLVATSQGAVEADGTAWKDVLEFRNASTEEATNHRSGHGVVGTIQVADFVEAPEL